MKGMSLEAPNKPSRKYPGSSTPVFLDSGATLSLLPRALTDLIAADFGSAGEDENGFYGVDCKFVGYEGTLDFEFEGVTIRVPYREIIRELSNPPRCYLGIVASDDFILLGDTFLRSAYGEFCALSLSFSLYLSLLSSIKKRDVWKRGTCSTNIFGSRHRR